MQTANGSLTFEMVDCNIGAYVYKAPVPGGWLVIVTCDVRTDLGDGRIDYGHEYRSAPTFIPDPNREWLPPSTKEMAESPSD